MQPILGSAAHGPFSGARGPASFFQRPRALIDGTFETRRLEGAAPPPRESPIPCMAQRQRHKSADVCRSAHGCIRRRRALQDAGAGKERSAPTQPAASPRTYTASGIRQCRRQACASGIAVCQWLCSLLRRRGRHDGSRRAK